MAENTFKIGDKEYPFKSPAGKKGRKATAYLLSALGSDNRQELGMEIISKMFMDEQFEVHLPALLGVDAKVLDEEGDLGQVMTALFGQITRIFETFNVPEVEAALKNSSGEEEEEKE